MSAAGSSKIDRRSFLSQGARAAAGVAVGTTALSYSRILGANDRIALGQIGVGNRGRGLAEIVGAPEGGAQRRDDGRVRSVEREPPEGGGGRPAGVRPRAAGIRSTGGTAGAQGRGRGPYRDARTLALADAEDGGRGGQGRVLREADGQRARGRQGRAGRGPRAQAHRADRDAAPERAVSARGEGPGADRRARRREQGRSGVELPRPPLAGAAGGEADPGAGHRLAAVADDPPGAAVRPAAVFRVPPVQGVLERDRGPVDEPRHRSGPLVHGRSVSDPRSSPTAACSPGGTGARTPTRSRRCSSTRRASWSATRRASATTRPASPATWARRRRS